jgi:hypothetical protein
MLLYQHMLAEQRIGLTITLTPAGTAFGRARSN